jgi:nitrate/TMAO reductase-like tetraheme cytochrome c subunit
MASSSKSGQLYRRGERRARIAFVRVGIVGALVLVGLVAGTAGWWVSDRLESDDAFCASCHLPDGEPLHRQKSSDQRDRPPLTLAAAHAAAGNPAHPNGAFRCIDCHGGTGWHGRARVKLLSARDAFWYVTGRFQEPEAMRWPLWDSDCSKCHASFEEEGRASGDPDFHELAVHNQELGVSCVTCHPAHPRGGLVEHEFLHPKRVRAQCARCHEEFEEENP